MHQVQRIEEDQAEADSSTLYTPNQSSGSTENRQSKVHQLLSKATILPPHPDEGGTPERNDLAQSIQSQQRPGKAGNGPEHDNDVFRGQTSRSLYHALANDPSSNSIHEELLRAQISAAVPNVTSPYRRDISSPETSKNDSLAPDLQVRKVKVYNLWTCIRPPGLISIKALERTSYRYEA
jgi:hypothetical protein